MIDSVIVLATVITIENYDHTVIMIVNYDRKTCIFQATGVKFAGKSFRRLPLDCSLMSNFYLFNLLTRV